MHHPSSVRGMHPKECCCCRTPLAAGVAQNFVNLSLDILLVVALGVGVVSMMEVPPAFLPVLTPDRSPSCTGKQHAHNADSNQQPANMQLSVAKQTAGY